MTANEKFMSFEAVVNIKTELEFSLFCQLCKQLRYEGIEYLARISFNKLHKSAGIQKIKPGELCVEYQLGKGFTIGDRKGYEDWGCEILSFVDFADNVDKRSPANV